jgi:hypothetical protein
VALRASRLIKRRAVLSESRASQEKRPIRFHVEGMGQYIQAATGKRGRNQDTSWLATEDRGVEGVVSGAVCRIHAQEIVAVGAGWQRSVASRDRN